MATNQHPDNDPLNQAQVAADQLVNREHHPGPDFERPNSGKTPTSTNDIANAEQSGSGGWKTNNLTPPKTSKDNKTKLNSKLKHQLRRMLPGGPRAAITTVVIGIAIVFALVTVLGPIAITVAAAQNLTKGLDSAGRAISNRNQRNLVMVIEAPACTGNAFKCMRSKPSNRALRTIAKATGAIPLDAKGNPINTSKRSGYPKEKPASFKLADGSKLAASDFGAHIENNPEFKGKLFGTKGLFNGHFSAWRPGKFINKAFRNPFGLKSNGGVADGDNNNKKLKTRRGLLDKIASKVPGYKSAGKVNLIIEKLLGGADGKSGRLGAAKFGGIAYTAAYSACLVSKIPTLTTAAVAGAQIVRLMPYINDIILSPASKTMASGVDPANAMTPGDAEVTGSILTQKTLDKDGNMTSAMDSQLLLAAMGINKSAVSPADYEKYIPGYSVVNWFNTNPAGKTWKTAQKTMAEGCSYIMSPVAMYAYAAIEAALTGINPVTFLLKQAGSVVVGLALVPVISGILGEAAKKMGLEQMLLNGFLGEDLEGIELGNTLGASALALFSAGSMARFVPGITAGGVETANASIRDYETDMKRMDIASMSPFDTSSQYTFMGSIVNSLRTASISTGLASGNATSIISSIFRVPQLIASPSAFAVSSSNISNQCSVENAKLYDLAAEDPSMTPLINPLGMPCGNLENTLGVDEAESILTKAGMIDTSKPVTEGADIESLITAEVIKKGTPLYLLAHNETGCNDASTGNYLIEAGGCTAAPVKMSTSKQADDSSVKGLDKIENCLNNDICTEDEISNGKVGVTNTQGDSSSNTLASSGPQPSGASAQLAKTTTEDPRVTLAMYTFLVDVQARNLILGEDDDTGSATSTAAVAGGGCAANTTSLGVYDKAHDNGKQISVELCELSSIKLQPGFYVKGKDPDIFLSGKKGGTIVGASVSEAFQKMGEQAKSEGHQLMGKGIRSYEKQEYFYHCYITKSCNNGNEAAKPGNSNHENGTAIDFVLGSGDLAWLRSNAKNYGMKELSGEPWHWSPGG